MNSDPFEIVHFSMKNVEGWILVNNGRFVEQRLYGGFVEQRKVLLNNGRFVEQMAAALLNSGQFC